MIRRLTDSFARSEKYIFRPQKKKGMNVIIVGMGALGLLFGERISRNLGYEQMAFLMDPERRRRHQKDLYRINGKEESFRMITPDELTGPADLMIVATKYNGLYEAREMMRPAVGPDTTIVSLMNGISSENILAEVFPGDQIPGCIAIGMDAVREGTSLSYQNIGRWQIGSLMPAQEQRLAALELFLKQAEIPYEVCADIRKAMWNKFMINVGINQTCMVYETGYGGATAEGSRAFADMSEAMHEVIRIAAAEKIDLTEEDYRKDIALLRSLDPELYPSMRQDAIAKRPSEVELFSGTVIRLAEKNGISVPVNERYYRWIKDIESRYGE